MSEQKRIPRHVAIIMDGNGRWAAQHGLERFEGHIRGVESVRRAIQAATRHGVRYLTLYAFSTENWGRPAAEVDALMELFCKSVINETPELAAQGVRVRIIGDKSRFPEKVKHHLDQIENRTATGKRLTLQLALNYSSRSEIVHAMQGLAGSEMCIRDRCRSRHLLFGRDFRANGFRSALYGGLSRPRPADTHQRRTTAQQFPAVAGCLRRTLFHPRIMARLYRRGFRAGTRRICPARKAFRTGKK